MGPEFLNIKTIKIGAQLTGDLFLVNTVDLLFEVLYDFCFGLRGRSRKVAQALPAPGIINDFHKRIKGQFLT
jgi:hypothetical protein